MGVWVVESVFWLVSGCLGWGVGVWVVLFGFDSGWVFGLVSGCLGW